MIRLACVSLVVCVQFATFSPQSAQAEDIVISDDNREILTGTWEGEYTSKDSSGKIRWASKVTFEVPQQGPPAKFGTFTLVERGAEWATEIEEHRGKVLLEFDKAQRPFVLSREGKRLSLETTYTGEFEGYERTKTLTLIKPE